MKKSLLITIILLAAANSAKTAGPSGDAAKLSGKQVASAIYSAMPASHAAAPADDLQTVLVQMNQAAPRFNNVQAEFNWETYTAAIKETEHQNGKSYFRRSGHGLEVMLNFADPDAKEPLDKQLWYKDGKVSIYEPKINRISEREVSKNKSDIDAAMNLGFGGSGDELMKFYDVKWIGWETINGVRTAKMELMGKTANLQKMFSKAVIWIDPVRDIAIQQQFFQTSEDYRLIRYHNPKFNEKISDSVFKLHTKDNPEKVKM
jgi:outer membrane lipoprotein-sorting protein